MKNKFGEPMNYNIIKYREYARRVIAECTTPDIDKFENNGDKLSIAGTPTLIHVKDKKVGNDFSEREIKILEELVFNILTISTIQARSKKGKGGIPLVINELDKTDGDIVKKEFVLGESIEEDVFEDLKNIINKRINATFKRFDIENIDILIGINYSL